MPARPHLLLIMVISGLLGVFAPGSIAATTAGREATDARAPRLPGYPPARLWYRVSATFHGTWRDPSDRKSIQFAEDWKLRSNTAVRLSFMCDDLRTVGEHPFFIRRQVGGHGPRIAVGGCPRGRFRRSHLSPTLRFDANAGGEVTRFHDSWASPGNLLCPDAAAQDDLIGTAPISGAVGSGSSDSGLAITVRLQPPQAKVHSHIDDRVCHYQDQDKTPFTVRGIDTSEVLFGSGVFALVGDEFIATPIDPGGWLPVGAFLTTPDDLLSGRQEPRFGRSFKIFQHVSQAPVPQDGSYPPPPPGASSSGRDEKRYSYSIRFRPCPHRGIDVKHC
jgi:hypothetical protein